MKKLIALLLCALLALTAVGCSGTTATTDTTADDAAAGTEATAETEETAESEGTSINTDGSITMDNIKVGFIHISDPSDGGYTYNHDKGTQKMQETLGLRDDQIVNKYNISEDGSCETAIKELIEAGCNIIFGTSFGFESYMVAAAAEHPEIEFCHATGYQAATSGLANMHNYFGDIFEARYLAGILAGMKTETNKIGYVTAMPFAECISGFTAFYLGAKSVNPDVTMEVMYTNSWNDPTKEAQVAQALIDLGCDVLSQHCDSTAPMTTAEKNGVWGCGYNSDMIAAAPNAAMTSAVWDWSIYLTYAINCVVNGEAIPTDFSGGLAEGVVDLSALNTDILPEGAEEAVEAAREKIVNGELEVFAGPLVDVDGNTVVAEGDVFVEPQSAPSWTYILEGIHVNE